MVWSSFWRQADGEFVKRRLLLCYLLLTSFAITFWHVMRNKRGDILSSNEDLPISTESIDDVDFFSPEFDPAEHVNAAIRKRQ